jgi:hypothetical protein
VFAGRKRPFTTLPKKFALLHLCDADYKDQAGFAGLFFLFPERVTTTVIKRHRSPEHHLRLSGWREMAYIPDTVFATKQKVEIHRPHTVENASTLGGF